MDHPNQTSHCTHCEDPRAGETGSLSKGSRYTLMQPFSICLPHRNPCNNSIGWWVRRLITGAHTLKQTPPPALFHAHYTRFVGAPDPLGTQLLSPNSVRPPPGLLFGLCQSFTRWTWNFLQKQLLAGRFWVFIIPFSWFCCLVVARPSHSSLGGHPRSYECPVYAVYRAPSLPFLSTACYKPENSSSGVGLWGTSQSL